MSNKPKLLDLFCKAGGAGVGYHRAGFEVVGVDIEPQPNYPFKFIQADAIHYLLEHGHEYVIVHASPPCQKWTCSTATQRKKGKKYLDLITATRNALLYTGKPYIIENVPQAPIHPDIVLMGHMFGLKVLRKRHFETSFFMLQPGIIKPVGTVKEGDYSSIFGKGAYKKSKNNKMPKHKKNTVRETWAYAMGIDWFMKDVELSEAIPPAYTEYIGKQAIELLFKNQ